MTEFIPYPFYHDDVPVDISFMFEDEKPAGKHGFLQVDGRDFVFEDGTKVKFWGTNFNGGGCFPIHSYSEMIAKRLSKIGLNLVRFHQIDSEWNTPNIFSLTKGKRMTDASFDPECLDRLDYLIHCLKQEGIYCYMDMFTYRRFRSEEGVAEAHLLRDAAKPYCYFDPHLIELQKDLCERIWTHENPYTGLRYCDDPVFVMAEVVNESRLMREDTFIEPYRTTYINMLDKWLKDTNSERTADDITLGDDNDDTLLEFRIYIQEKYYKEMMDFMHKIGVKIPITGTNYAFSPFNMISQRVTDFVDTHTYFNEFVWKEDFKSSVNKSITQAHYHPLMLGGQSAYPDKPLYISEWDAAWPNEYRADFVLYMAAMGLFQEWSGYAIHTYSYTTSLDRMNILGKEVQAEKIGNITYRPGLFSTWNDPAKFGLFYHAAIMTRRGDVKGGLTTLSVKPASLNEYDDDTIWRNIEKQKIAMDFDIVEKKKRVEPGFSDEALSDTGELFISRKKNYGYIDTDRTKCAYGFLAKNGTIGLSGVKVTAETDFAVIAMSSLTDEKITESSNILLTTVGRAQNTDAKFVGEQMMDYGRAPITVEAIKAEIEIETPISTYEVWGISPEGFYIGMVPTKYEDGKLTISLGTESRSMYFMIVKN